MLFVPVDLLIEEVLDNEVVYCTKKYELDRWLVGCCDNTWYKINWFGVEMGLGVAYHS
jgi:hypothetical protein